MNLTSLRRVKYALGLNKADQDHILSRLVGAASRQIAYYLRRMGKDGLDALQLKSRTEYIDPIPGQRTLYPRAFPITSITSIHTDSYGRYDGDESLVDADDYLIGSDLRSIHFSSLPSVPDYGSSLPTVPRGVRLIYTAGLAADPVVSSWTKSADVGGDLTVGHYILGGDSLAVGSITARAAGTISYECLAGIFQAAETLTEYRDLDFKLQDGGLKDPTGITATLTTQTANSLAEAEPALVEACEMHIRYLFKNRNDFENIIVSRDGENRVSRADLKNTYDFLPEIRSILEPYRNRLVT